jgi:hypothetical protein
MNGRTLVCSVFPNFRVGMVGVRTTTDSRPNLREPTVRTRTRQTFSLDGGSGAYIRHGVNAKNKLTTKVSTGVCVRSGR